MMDGEWKKMSNERINKFLKGKSVFEVADMVLELGYHNRKIEQLYQEYAKKNLKKTYEGVLLDDKEDFDYFYSILNKKMKELENSELKTKGKLVKFPEANGHNRLLNPSYTRYRIAAWSGIYGKPLLGFESKPLIYLVDETNDEKLIICGTREKRFFGEKIRLIPYEDTDIVKERLLTCLSKAGPKDSRSNAKKSGPEIAKFENISFWDEENHSLEESSYYFDTIIDDSY